MDSGNSGSLQSSSGDEEYDSRADAISAALMNDPRATAAAPPHVGPISNHPLPPPSLSSSMFDPMSNYFDPISRPPQAQQTLLHLDMTWPKTLRSEPNSSSSAALQSLFAAHGQVQNPAISIPPAVPENSTSATNTPRGGAADQHHQPHAVRNPKKRSRASRRAPTTVLTTDTTNFRAMVQEFTGIPAPPFTASSPFPRSRLDLYGTPSTSMRSNNQLDISQPPYLRRPFPQKVQLPPPFLGSSPPSSLLNSSVIDHVIASSNTNNLTSGLSINTTPNSTTSSLNFQLPPDLGLLKQPPQSSSLFNIPNPILTSLLQANPPKSSSSLEVPNSNDSRLKMSFMDEFGLNHGGSVTATSLSGLPGLISSDQTVSRNDNTPINWVNGMGSVHENDQCQPRNAANGKLNFSTPPSGFPGEKSSDTVAAAGGGRGRGEGMMESWICSSE